MVPQAAGLGEFTAGYAATLTPDSQLNWVITHNLGVVPKLVIVEMVGTPTLTNYAIKAVYVPNVQGFESFANTGYKTGFYYYNDTQYDFAGGITNTSMELGTSTVKLPMIYNNARSPWDTGSQYRVQIYG